MDLVGTLQHLIMDRTFLELKVEVDIGMHELLELHRVKIISHFRVVLFDLVLIIGDLFIIVIDFNTIFSLMHHPNILVNLLTSFKLTNYFL